MKTVLDISILIVNLAMVVLNRVEFAGFAGVLFVVGVPWLLGAVETYGRGSSRTSLLAQPPGDRT